MKVKEFMKNRGLSIGIRELDNKYSLNETPIKVTIFAANLQRLPNFLSTDMPSMVIDEIMESNLIDYTVFKDKVFITIDKILDYEKVVRYKFKDFTYEITSF